jgi:hypothetical protein
MIRGSHSGVMLFLLLCFFGAEALVIESPTDVSVYYHVTGAFGPSRYNESSAPVFASPPNGCPPVNWQYGDPVDGAESSPLRGSVAMIMRGDCYFVAKCLYAQTLGAIACVVGDNQDSPNLLTMNPSPGDNSSAVKIPSLFVSRRTYFAIYNGLARDPLVARVNGEGEVRFEQTWETMVLPFLGVMLGLGLLWSCRWMVSRRRNVRARRIQASELPLVDYTAGRVHNDSCVICLADFEQGNRIKVLPCNHGFHTECIDPWINDRSEHCPICKMSILEGPRRRWLLGIPCCACCSCCLRPAPPPAENERNLLPPV